MGPPNNFRHVSVYPNKSEILGPSPSDLRKNIIKGEFESIDDYLDIHFRLLREDFISSVREGVRSYRVGQPTRNLDVYQDVKIFKQRTKSNGECLKIRIPPQTEDSKKFMNGSLLLFTRNNFESIALAKIVRSNPVTCDATIDAIDANNNLVVGTPYTMAECDAYFDPYFHILNVLQTMPKSDFPMEKYLIEVDILSVYIPKYLLQSGRNYEIGNYRLPPEMVPKFRQNSQGLNEAQFHAFKAALSQEFVVIQGPPGTGKTYLGVKIVETLLRNHKFWYKKSPILVISQKNYALDHFLEGLLPITKSLIRVGSQSKSDKLKQYNMTYEDVPGGTTFRNHSPMANLGKLRDALVVGMTTSCAARWRQCLESLESPIVVVEEASEVLEAHVLAALTKHCRHLILLGDHLQLQPITSDYEIGTKYRLGVSLFERMINNGIQCYTLNVQHRMRPEISNLLRSKIYPFLKDHESTLNRPHVLGVSKNVYFIDHQRPEEKFNVTSKKNKHEAEFLVALAKHLVLNGHKPCSIVILATYAGQVQELEGVKMKILDGVRISTLDAFQGQESDVVLLSLVRSEAIGFLGIQNRVCVGLSRARNGFFIIGNMDLLTSKSGLWHKVKKCLQQQNSIGEELPLKCEAHPKTITKVKCAADFQTVRDGGCSRQCRSTLKCGHSCRFLCHTSYKQHACRQDCTENLWTYRVDDYRPDFNDSRHSYRGNETLRNYVRQDVELSQDFVTKVFIGIKDLVVSVARSFINWFF